jgi:hypothetical protein
MFTAELHHRCLGGDAVNRQRPIRSSVADTAGQPSGPTPAAAPSLRQGLAEASTFSPAGLALAVGGSVVGTVLVSAVGTGPWGTLAGAAVTPLVTTAFATRSAGDRGRVRVAIIAVLSAAALAITWTGVSAADLAAGKSVVPGTTGRPGTFPGLASAQVSESNTGTGTGHTTATKTVSGTARSATATAVDCGSAGVRTTAPCRPGAVLTYTGPGTLTITGVEVTGDQAGEFTAGSECVGRQLTDGETCETSVSFTPAAAGRRVATLVVHQSLPRPDRGTPAALAGTGTDSTGSGGTGSGGTGTPTDPDQCLTGFVWREAVPGDHVCVPPAIRTQTQQDNALAASRRSPDGGPFGPDTCVFGFVWREAVPGDHVCVTGETRTEAQQDNALAASRRVG